MAKPKATKRSRLSAEEQLLEKQRSEILQRAQELEKRLKRLPAALEAQEEQRRKIVKQQAVAAGPAISPYMGRADSRRRSSRRNRTLRTPSYQRYVAKLRAFGWLILLGIIIFVLWRIVPAS